MRKDRYLNFSRTSPNAAVDEFVSELPRNSSCLNNVPNLGSANTLARLPKLTKEVGVAGS